jgi:hypothetical protein
MFFSRVQNDPLPRDKLASARCLKRSGFHAPMPLISKQRQWYRPALCSSTTFPVPLPQDDRFRAGSGRRGGPLAAGPATTVQSRDSGPAPTLAGARDRSAERRRPGPFTTPMRPGHASCPIAWRRPRETRKAATEKGTTR